MKSFYKIFYIICISIFISCNISCNVPSLKNLKKIENFEQLSNIQKIIKFPEYYEQPFLKGIPEDLPIELVKKIQNLPHCAMPFILPDPWIAIPYERMPYLLLLSNYFLDPDSYGVIFNNKEIFLPNYNGWEIFEKAKLKKNNKIITINKGLHLLQRCSIGYYHFVIELLPRLMLAIDILRNDTEIKILMSEPHKKFMDEYFQLFDIDLNRVVYCNPQHYYFVEQLYFPKPAFMGYPSQQELFRVKNYLLSKLNLNQENDLIVIIERLEQGRHVNNTRELINAIIKNFPYLKEKIVIFTGISSAIDQIKLFNKAKFIIGPHGAGFSNMLYSNTGTFIIEFMPLNYLGILFWHLSKTLGLNLQHLIIPNADKYSSFDVPINKVISILKNQLTQELLYLGVAKYLKNTTISIDKLIKNINQPLDKNGNNLFMCTINDNNYKLAKLLYNLGINIFIKNYSGNDAWDQIEFDKNNPEYKEILEWLKIIYKK